ncbi:terminase [Streptomyces sp. SBT349]|uniref:terminase n=1 Tax=Streptomyces sp. SBT349 TaxID=1580539 RepID=UPI00066B18F3|nr:terminase [Streptomyces sp. SBT349]
MPRELVHAPSHDRDRSLGLLGWAWVEHFCVHGPGDVQGDPVEMDGEFGGFLVDAYALRKDGRRIYDSAVISRGKGRAKSELAGFIGLFEAFGPCRFRGWAKGGEVFEWRDFRYEYQPGEPMGRFVTYPFIRCLATEETQVGNTYDNIYYNLTEGPLGEDLPTGAAGITRTFIPGGGEIRPSTASSSAKDGGKETCTIADETHLYVTPELRRMYVTVDRNCRKRKEAQPWLLQTTTMYQPGDNSVAEKTHERAKLVAEAVKAGGEPRSARLLYDHREAPPDVDLTDRGQLIAALREVYGPFASVLDLDGIVENEFWNIEKDPEDSRRYFFNQPTAARDAWTTKPAWAACADVERIVPVDAPMVMFFDGSKNDDATALVGCDVESGHVMTLGCWEKPAGPDGKGWQVDRADVDRTVRAVFDERDVIAFFADVKEFESYVDSWALEFGERLLVQATVGRHQHPVAWDMRGKVREFTEACERAEIDIRERDLTHDGDSRLQRHVLNARRRPNRYGVSIAKESRESPKKIDSAVCAVGARMVRRLVLASPEWAKRKQKQKRRTGRVVGWR